MKMTDHVSIRYVEMETEAEYRAWKAGLEVLWTVIQRYQAKIKAEQEQSKKGQVRDARETEKTKFD